MSIIQVKSSDVKDVHNVPNVLSVPDGTFVPGGGDRATLESDLSTSPAPSGRAVPPESPARQGLAQVLYPTINCRTTDQALPSSLGGVKAINSPGDVISPGAVPNKLIDVSCSSSSRSGGLVGFKPANCHVSRNAFLRNSSVSSIATRSIVEAFRVHCYKLESSPYVYLLLKHKADGSLAIYRANSCSWSRYFPEGRYNIRKDIYQRLEGSASRGVFFHLTVDPKRFDLVHSWPSMWPQFNRFKKALNLYRKRNMNAKGGIRYLAAIEPHESGFPHLHVYCPGLRWLIKRDDLHKMDKWWGLGSVRTEKELRHDTARDYVLKYISKLDGWDEASMAMLWHFKTRIYNLSHRYYLAKSESEWETLGRYMKSEALAHGLADVGIRFGVKQVEGLIKSMDDIGEGLVYLTTTGV